MCSDIGWRPVIFFNLGSDSVWSPIHCLSTYALTLIGDQSNLLYPGHWSVTNSFVLFMCTALTHWLVTSLLLIYVPLHCLATNSLAVLWHCLAKNPLFVCALTLAGDQSWVFHRGLRHLMVNIPFLCLYALKMTGDQSVVHFPNPWYWLAATS